MGPRHFDISRADEGRATRRPAADRQAVVRWAAAPTGSRALLDPTLASERADLNVEIVQDARATLGECPVWDPRTERLHWVDIRAGLIHRFSPSDGSDLVVDVGQPVGSVGLGADGGLVVALRDGFGVIPANTDRIDAMIEVEKPLVGNRMNDG